MVPVAQETTANTVRLPYSFSRRFSLVAWCEASLEILHVHPLSLSVLQELQRGLNAPFTLRQIDEAEFEQRLNTARFSRTLSILTASSVPLLEGIQTAAAVSANRYVEQQLLLAADRVREGSSLRAALAELRLFPPMMLYMIASGEQSGELETMLEQAAVNQEREFDTQVGLALGLFEPALVVMMAGVVLFIVIAILEPMLQLNNMVGM